MDADMSMLVIVGVVRRRVAVLRHNGGVDHFGGAHLVQGAQDADIAVDDKEHGQCEC